MYSLSWRVQGIRRTSHWVAPEVVVMASLKDLDLGSDVHTSLYALLILWLGELLQLASGLSASPHERVPLSEFGARSLPAHPDVSAVWDFFLWP